jgi:O-antigen/teichoic acid export membrane protein
MFVDIFVFITAILSYLILIPPLGAVGGALAFAIAVVINNILYHIGLIRFTGTVFFDFSYLRVYAMIIGGTLALLLIQVVFSPPLFVTLPIAALISLVVLRANVRKLQVEEMFPELLKIPVIKRLVR